MQSKHLYANRVTVGSFSPRISFCSTHFTRFLLRPLRLKDESEEASKTDEAGSADGVHVCGRRGLSCNGS